MRFALTATSGSAGVRRTCVGSSRVTLVPGFQTRSYSRKIPGSSPWAMVVVARGVLTPTVTTSAQPGTRRCSLKAIGKAQSNSSSTLPSQG